MRTGYRLGLVTLLVPITAFAQAAFPDHCSDGSALPFSTIEVKHPIDGTCGIAGKKTSPAPSQVQNKVKNDFCQFTAGGTPNTFLPTDLAALQAKTTIASGHGKEPADRAPLDKLGEGKLVRMKAFLIEAHHADLGGGESVNCNGGTELMNDIHMAMSAKPDAEECNSVSAEISPHYRPASWNEIGHFETFNSTTKKYTPNPAMAARLQSHPYRITGQLFFDASHEVCPCGTSCSPTRASLWEIHPIYNIEVCKAGASCDESKDVDWIAFDDWWKSMPPIRKSRGPHSHTPHEPQ